jgi:hypothetical protein
MQLACLPKIIYNIHRRFAMMTEKSFSLIPFPAPNIPDVTITGNISYQNNLLALHYCLAGDLQAIFLPSFSARPSRRDELWKTTCFEFFLAIKGQPQYWEFNMSPSGDWNVYRMDAYRKVGFREEASMQRLPFEVRREEGVFALHAIVDLKPVLLESQPFEVGVTAVIQTKDGKETYWAMTHPAPDPDFHRRESFILAPAGQTHPSSRSVPGS